MYKYLIFLLPFENIFRFFGINLNIQTFPIIYLFVIIFYYKLVFKIIKTTIFNFILLLIAYITFISILFFEYELAVIGINDRFVLFLRNFISLVLGVLFFLFMRNLFVHNNQETIFKSIVKTTYIILPFIIFDIVSGEARVKGTFTEPSHLGQYIAFILIPSYLIVYRNMNLWDRVFFLITTGVMSLLTFSGTLVIRLALLLLGYFVFSHNLAKRIFIILILFFLIYAVEIVDVLFPGNYLTAMAVSLWNLLTIQSYYIPESLLDRGVLFYIIYYLLSTLNINIFTFLGYGFGGEMLYYEYFLPKELAEIIKNVKFHQEVYISSFAGKIFVYGGIIGSLIYLILIIRTFKIINYYLKLNDKKVLIKSILFAIFAYSSFGLGQFMFIEFWFWLAFVDSKQLTKLKSLRSK